MNRDQRPAPAGQPGHQVSAIDDDGVVDQGRSLAPIVGQILESGPSHSSVVRRGSAANPSTSGRTDWPAALTSASHQRSISGASPHAGHAVTLALVTLALVRLALVALVAVHPA